MAQRRRLTADGPQAAYLRLITQTTSNKDTSSGIGETPPERRDMGRRYVENIDSDGESTRMAGNLVLSQARPRGGPRTESDPHEHAQARETVLVERHVRDSLPRHEPEAEAEAEPQPPPGPPQSTTAYNMLYLDLLKRKVKDQGETILLLQKAQTIFLQQSAELPRFCRWECISKVLTDIVSLSLGPGLNSHFYPSEDELIPKILEAFNIKMEMKDEVEAFLTEWGKGGKTNIQMRVSDNIRDRRGSILRTLREEFYNRLGLPKPRRTDTEESRSAWKQQLLTLKHAHSWRTQYEGDTMDPWGSNAVHNSISKVIFGVRFDVDAKLDINLKQAGFFFYNLELAMDGAVMEPGRMLYHVRKMKEMEDRIKHQFQKEMKRIIVHI